MALQESSNDEGDAAGANTFSNDGSFMEQFMKMQKEKSEPKTEPATLISPRSSVKQASIKKSTPTSFIQKRIKSLAAKKVVVTGSNNKGTGEPSVGPEPSTTCTSSSTMADTQSAAAASPSTSTTTSNSKGRKRKSKWDMGSTPVSSESQTIDEAIGSFTAGPVMSAHSLVLPRQQLTSAQEQQLKEQIAMQKMVAEIKTATESSVGSKRNRYEYDSDEDVEEGTWEHKSRNKEMKLTEEKAKDLTEMGKGKHHIGDFLPPEELEKFVETVQAVKEDRTPDLSDYKEHKLTEENIGFKLLQKSGWDEGTGLGAQQQGITAPVNKGKTSFDQSGVGAVKPADVEKSDNEFDLYRKRMMLAYRFRPNPLNNPRRPYY